MSKLINVIEEVLNLMFHYNITCVIKFYTQLKFLQLISAVLINKPNIIFFLIIHNFYQQFFFISKCS